MVTHPGLVTMDATPGAEEQGASAFLEPRSCVAGGESPGESGSLERKASIAA